MSVSCDCGARWQPFQERRGAWRAFAWEQWRRHHGGPLRPCAHGRWPIEP